MSNETTTLPVTAVTEFLKEKIDQMSHAVEQASDWDDIADLIDLKHQLFEEMYYEDIKDEYESLIEDISMFFREEIALKKERLRLTIDDNGYDLLKINKSDVRIHEGMEQDFRIRYRILRDSYGLN